MKIRPDILTLTDLLIQMMVEASPKNNCEVSNEAKQKTAESLQRAYNRGELKKNENEEYYYPGMSEDFGGYIEKDIYDEDLT